MFIYEPQMTKEAKKIIHTIKDKIGMMPPHWELFAKMNPKRFEMFIGEIDYLLKHANINPDFFSMTRLYIANRENFEYCKKFNTKLLLAKGYSRDELAKIKEDFTLSLDKKYQILANKVKKAIYEPNNFTKDDIELLHKEGWSDSDIWDGIDHGTFLFKFSKILKVYLP